MKITAAQLRKIIKEEVSRIIQENAAPTVAETADRISRDRKFQAAIKRGDHETASTAAAATLQNLGLNDAADWVTSNMSSDPEFISSPNYTLAAFAVTDALQAQGLLADAMHTEWVVQIGQGVDDVSRSMINKVQTKHGVKVRLTGRHTHNPNYKVMPSFATEQEALDFVDQLTVDGIDAGIFEWNGSKPYWG